MPFVACDENGNEIVCSNPIRRFNQNSPISELKTGRWIPNVPAAGIVILPKGSIEKLIGRPLTWNDDAVQL